MKTQLKFIEPFFTEELDYKNDYVTYIEVGNSSSVTPKINSIKNRLKTAKNKHSALIIFGKGFKSLQRELRLSEENGFQNDIYRKDMREFQKINRAIRNNILTFPHPHNNALSLV